MNIYLLIPLLSFFISLSVAILVILSNPRKKLNYIFSLYVCTIVWWSITEYMMRGSSDSTSAFFWSRIFSLGSIFMAPLFLTFALFFTRNKITEKKWIFPVIFFPITVMAILGYTTDIFTLPKVTMMYWGWQIVENTLYPIPTYFSFFYIIVGLYLIFRFYRKKANTIEKKQSLLFLIGVTFSLVVSGLTQSKLPFMEAPIVPLGTMSTAIKTCIYAFAMIKYRLLVIPPVVAMKTIFNNLDDIIITINPDKTVAMANPAALRTLKYTKDELIGKPIDSIFVETHIFRDYEWEKVLEEGSMKGFGMNMITKDREKVPVRFSCSVVRDSGEVAGIISISSDMRETDKLIHELEKSKAELSSKIEKLELFTKIAVGRELKMIELKKRIKELEDLAKNVRS